MIKPSIFRTNFRTGANRPGTSTAAAPAKRAAPLVRAFVETGDERCPLAGIWSRLPLCDQPADDPHLGQPVIGSFLPWRAIHPALIAFQYHLT